MEKKEKPLEKLTAKELREMALAIGGIFGVHAMKKDELIAAIRKSKGLPEEEGKKAKRASRQEGESGPDQSSTETEDCGIKGEKRGGASRTKFQAGRDSEKKNQPV